jgi:hypothetical protein
MLFVLLLLPMNATKIVQRGGGYYPLALNYELPDFSGSCFKVTLDVSKGCDGCHGTSGTAAGGFGKSSA